MVAKHHFSRVGIPEVKNLIYGEIGHQRAEQYFELVKHFLESKLSKVEFDRRCAEVIGNANISLHNRLIRSIIHNAVRAKVPPPKPQKVQGLGVKVPNTCQRNTVQTICGKAFLQSPRKCRSPVNRERKFRDRLSPLGPLGKSPSLTCEETASRVQEESAAETQSLSSKPLANEDGEEVEQDAAQVPINQWPVEQDSSQVPINQCPVKQDATQVLINQWPVEQDDAQVPIYQCPFEQDAAQVLINQWPIEQDAAQVMINQCLWSDVTAPFGVSVNKGSVPLSLFPGFSYNNAVENCQSSQELPDTLLLMNRMQKILAPEGVGISMESAKLLNNSLDVFLKRLITPCIEVTQSHSSTDGRQPYGQKMPIFNGTIPGQNAQFSAQPSYASALDFWVAMESNPSILGQDWPIHLEKIYHYNVW